MFIKMRESKGFTLVELMIVVAIIGILAAVAVPYYQRYIQKSRLTSLVMPGMHALQTNVGSYFSLNNVFPVAATTIAAMSLDANSSYWGVVVANTGMTFTIKATGSKTNPLLSLTGQQIVASALMDTTKTMIIGWVYSGNLATNLGLAGVQ